MDLYQKLQAVPSNAVKLSLAVGKERKRVTTVKAWEEIPEEVMILDELYAQGFGSEFKYARLNFRDKSGKGVKSISLVEELPEGQREDTSVLSASLVEMTKECRRWMEIQMRYAAEREQRNAELIDQLMKANELILRERTTALALDLALQHKEENEQQDTDFKVHALDRLSHLGEYFMQQKFLTPEVVKGAVLHDESLLKAISADPEFMTRLMSKIGTKDEN